MAHFAIQLGNVGVELEDEDMTAKGLSKIGAKVLRSLVELIDGDEEDDDGE